MYNKSAIRDYAKKYYLNGNADYRSFWDQGGDCTNFVSQSLFAGGWEKKGWAPWHRDDDDKWFYNRAGQSYTWTGADNWRRFATKSGRVKRISRPRDARYGDILQVDYGRDGTMEHSMVVVGRWRGDPKRTLSHG